jgi:RNA polymerase sigma factor (sigma-70 family)
LIRALNVLTLTVMGIVQNLDIPENDDDLVAQIVASQVNRDRDETKRLVETLYRKHSGAVYARLASLASSSQVDDLAQETWIRILEKLHLYKEGNFRAWALTIARHHFLDWVRAKRPLVLKSEVDVVDGGPDRDQERSTRSEWAQILRECLTKLNERHREVVVGIIYEQSDYKALCVKLGITANEAYKLKHEAKELLANCCQRANR